tara:strand:+ start:1921 stop:2439 length:519 start_codon:yes stop_codon:yes gene_type:complete
MKIKIFPSFIIISFLLIFFVFYKGLEITNIYTPDTNIKKDIPFFEAKLFDENNSSNSDEIFNDDKFYLLNIWASWCVPCRDEHPFLVKLGYQDNIEVIGLNYKDKKDNAKKFLKELKNPYKVILSDKDGTIAIEWGAYGVPETFLIHNKIIIKRFIGPLNNKTLSEIKKLIE